MTTSLPVNQSWTTHESVHAPNAYGYGYIYGRKVLKRQW